MSLMSNEGRREGRISAAFPLRYAFMHGMERRNTKSFRSGSTHDVSQYGLSFVAPVVDPSIFPDAQRADVLVAVDITLPGGAHVVSTCRLAWTEADPHGREGHYLLGLEFTTLEHGAPEDLVTAAINAIGS